jgi:hypothetical protein
LVTEPAEGVPSSLLGLASDPQGVPGGIDTLLLGKTGTGLDTFDLILVTFSAFVTLA